jgi:hypothetical protein
MASTRDYDLEKRRWRWTFHLFRGVVAVCVLYVVGTQIIERAARSAAQPPLAAPPSVVEPPPLPRPLPPPPPPPPPVVEAPPPPPAPEPPPPPPAPPVQTVQAPPRPTFRVPGLPINGRSGPGVNFGIVRRVSSDQVLVATGEARNGWIEVVLSGAPEDQKFWVYRNLLRPAEE